VENLGRFEYAVLDDGRNVKSSFLP
jgi:hypothetical protein